ncbi:hypothetical protein DFH06DRAFT_745042 [Mycena polygramma]|nr:hypothetical protein DFH06DRAFT_745042 [Mycena polygramma]
MGLSGWTGCGLRRIDGLRRARAYSLPRPTTRRPAVIAPPALALFAPRRGRRRPTAARSTTTTDSTTEGPRREDQEVRRTGDAWPSRTPRYVVAIKLIKTPSRGGGRAFDSRSVLLGLSSSGVRSWCEECACGPVVVVVSACPSRRPLPDADTRTHADKAPHAHRHRFLEPSGTPRRQGTRRPQGTQVRKATTLTSTQAGKARRPQAPPPPLPSAAYLFSSPCSALPGAAIYSIFKVPRPLGTRRPHGTTSAVDL